MNNKFARCKEIAIIVAGAMPTSVIAYGLYFPVTPKKSWDERWRDCNFFTHFWVEKEGTIIDGAKEQFGEGFLNIVPVDDFRYIKVGEYDPTTDVCTPTSDEPQINWGTFTSDPLDKVSVIWEPSAYKAHMSMIDEIRQKSA